MDELVTLARPYAKASFKYANETKTLPQWSAVLAILAAASKEPAVVDLLYSPAVRADELGEEHSIFDQTLCSKVSNAILGIWYTIYKNLPSTTMESMLLCNIPPVPLGRCLG